MRQQRRAAGEQAGVPCREQGWSRGTQRRQQLFGSSVSTWDHCPSASSVLTEAATGQSIAFCGSTSIEWHHSPPLSLGKVMNQTETFHGAAKWHSIL